MNTKFRQGRYTRVNT